MACSNTYQCISGLGLTCSSSKCSCSSNQYWDGLECSKQKISVLNQPG